MPESREPTVVRIGACRFDASAHEIERDGERVRLPRRLSQLLLRLVKDAPQVVERQTLIDEVWQRRMVEDDVLSRAIADLRRALGDDPREPRYIETIPKSGYRLCAAIAPDLEAGPEASAHLPLVAPGASATRRPMRPWLAPIVAATLALVAWVYWNKPEAPGIVAADFVRERPLTSAPGWEYGPALSADGRWIAYAESASAAEGSVVVLQEIAGGARHSIGDDDGWNLRPAFSSDDKRIAYLHIVGERCELRVRPVLGGTARRLAECALRPTSTPVWSGDDASIVFTAPAQSAAQAPGLAMVQVEGGEQRALTTPDIALGPDRDARFVPKTTRISFMRGDEAGHRLLSLDLDREVTVQALYGAHDRIYGHAWSADGKQLTVASDAPGFRALLSVDPADGSAEILGGRGARYPTLSARGDLVWEAAAYDANIWRLDLSAAQAVPELAVRSTRYDASPVVSPDGRSLAYVSTRNDFEQVFLISTAGDGAERQLQLPAGRRWNRPAFAADGSALLIHGYEADGRSHVYRYDLLRETHTRLEALGAGASLAQYAEDGRSIVFARDQAHGVRRLFRIDADLGSDAAALGQHDDIDELHVDGATVAYTRQRRPGIVVLDLRTSSAAATVLEDTNLLTSYCWTLAGGALYFVAMVEQRALLQSYDLQSSTRTTLATGIDADAVGPALALSPDRRWLWFARTDNLALDLMLLPARATD